MVVVVVVVVVVEVVGAVPSRVRLAERGESSPRRQGRV